MCHYAECHCTLVAGSNISTKTPYNGIMLSIVILSVIMFSVVVLRVIMLLAIMLSVVMLSAVLLNVITKFHYRMSL